MAGRVRAFVGPDASLALVGPLGELLWSSMDDEEAAYISDIVRKLSGFLSRGDYYVGSLKGKKVIVLKATDKVCLALVAEAKEGVMLYALRSLLNAFPEKIAELESKVAEEAIRAELEVCPVEVLDPASGREVKVVPADAIPYVPEGIAPRAIKLDSRLIDILRVVDGKTVADIARELGMDVREACELVARLLEEGVLKAKVAEELKGDYNIVFTPKAALGDREVLAREDIGLFEKFILMNIGRGLTVLELSWGLRGLGLDLKPDDVLSLLKKMEEAGLIVRGP